MATKNYKSKATPIEKELTVPGRTRRGYEERKGTEFLPRYLRSDINKKFLDATIDQLISNDSTRRINNFFGSKSGLVNNPVQNFYDNSNDKLKEDYRFRPGIVSNNDDNTTTVHMSYDDILNRLNFLGGDTTNHDRLFQDVNYVWRPIVNENKLVNFAEYYWFNLELPLCQVDGTFNPQDIIGKKFHTVPAYNNKQELELQNGMLISFGPQIQATYPGVYTYVDVNGITQARQYVVEQVGDSITFLDYTLLSKKTPYTPKVPEPWDNLAWDTNPWDGSQDAPALKEYIVMERGSQDQNAWSRINCWYHINCVKAVYKYNDQVLEENSIDNLQAKRPIIEFARHFTLYNFGTHARGNAIAKITDVVWFNNFLGSNNVGFTPGGSRIYNGLNILVTDTGLPQYDNFLWEVNGVGSGITLTKVTDGRDPQGDPTLGDKILDTETGNEFMWNGTKWIIGQNKTEMNQAPLFDLFDYEGNKLSDELVYPNSNFSGNKVFEYVRNDLGTLDKELNFKVMYNSQSSPATTSSDYANLVFCFDQEKTVYRYNLDTTATDILGYYYVGQNTSTPRYSSGWEKINVVNRTPLVENIIIKNETNLEIDLKTESYGGSLDNIVEYEITHSETGYDVYQKTKFTCNRLRDKNSNIFIARGQATSIKYDSGVNGITITDEAGVTYNGSGIIGSNASPYTSGIFAILPDANTPDVLKYTGAKGTGFIFVVDNGTQEQFPEVHYNGKLAKFQIDWDIVNNKIVLPLNNNIKQKRITALAENDVIDIRYVSDESVTNPTYDQNSSFVANPKNGSPGQFTFSDYFDHFTTIVNNHNGFKGDRFGENNFENLPKQLGVQGKIQQHENNALLYGPIFAKQEYSIINALRYTGDQVDRFRTKFLQTLHRLYNEVSSTITRYELVDLALKDINVGKNANFPFAFSNMAFSTNFTEQDIVGDGNTTVFDLTTPVELGDFGQHVYIYVNDFQKVIDVDYTITNTQITFVTAPALNDNIKIRVANKDALTLIPTSLSKLGLDAVYSPRYFDGNQPGPNNLGNQDPFIQYHDGALEYDISEYDFINECVIELERRIYNHINAEFKEKIIDNRLDAHANRNQYADNTLVREMAEERFNTWLIQNGKTASDKQLFYKNTIYDVNDKFTYNYAVQVNAIKPNGPGYWRGIYKMFFGTYNPAITPWRCLGHADKPLWWTTYYPDGNGGAPEWQVGTKRNAFIEALRIGNVGNPADGITIDVNYARGTYAQYLPVDPATGLLQDPITCGLLSAPTTQQAQADFRFGDHLVGLEMDWNRSAKYRFDIKEIMMLVSTGDFLKDWNTASHTTSLNGERVRKDTYKRPTPADYDFHRYTDNNNVMEKSFGLNHLVIENLVARNQSSSNNLRNEIINLDTKLMFKLEGFTDKNTIRLVTDSISQTSDRFVPEEDFNIALYQSPPLVAYEMSSVKVLFDGEAYQVIGRNNVDPYFTINPSRQNGRSIDVTVGSETVVKYLEGTGTPTRIDYGTKFTRRQDVYDFFIAYDRHLKAQGFVLDNNSNMDTSGQTFITWSSELRNAGEFVEMSPFKAGVKYDFAGKGFVGNTDTIINEVYNLKDSNNKEIRPNNVNVTRLEDEMKIIPIGDQDIFFVRLYTTEYDHVVHLSQKTVFNDTLYDPLLNIKLDRIKFIGQRTADWTGVPKAKGYLLNEDKLITNFEKSVNDVDRGYFDVEDTVLNQNAVDAARHNLGYVTQDYLKNNLYNKDVSFEFWKGLIHKKGTPSAYKNLLRSLNVDNNLRDIDVQEEWMLKLGEYGGQAVTQDYEVELPAGNLSHNPQIVSFEEDIRADRLTNKDLEFDTKITITANDPRWVNKPEGANLVSFPTMSSTKYNETKLLSAGLPFETDVDFALFDTKSLTSAYSGFAQPGSIPVWTNNRTYEAGDLVRYNGQVYVANTTTDGSTVNEANILDFTAIDEPLLPSYWIAKHDVGNTTRPSVLKAQDHNFAILEICAGIEETDNALVKCDQAHGLAIGDYVLICNSTTTPIVDGIYQVLTIESDNNFTINAFINEKGFTGKFFPLREMMFSTKTEIDALKTDTKYKLRNGDFAYTDDAVYKWNTSITDWVKVRESATPVDTSSMFDIKIYDSHENKIIAQFENIDPRKGIISGQARRELNIINQNDIAKYTSSNDDTFVPNETRFWAGSKVGTTWWDTSTAVYQNPEQDLIQDNNKEYKFTHWGKLHPACSIDVYEWTKSLVTPDQYNDSGLNSGTPFNTVDENGVRNYFWSQDIEYDTNTGQPVTCYYYWVKNKTTKPSMKNIDRKLSVFSIAQLIQNPTKEGVLWASAASTKDLLIGNGDKVLLDEASVLEFHFKNANQTNHTEYYLVRENDEIEIIPEYFHKRLRASLVGRQGADTSLQYKDFDINTNYSKGEIVMTTVNTFFKALKDNPAGPSPVSSGSWERLYDARLLDSVNKRFHFRIRSLVPNLNVHPLMRYGIESRPAQSWFRDIDGARRVFVQKANELLKDINLVDTVLDWDRILGQTAFIPQFGNPNVSFDVTQHWSYINWQDPVNYVDTVPEKDVANFVALQNETPTDGRIIRVLNDGTGRFEIWLGDGQFWNLIEKENATIKLNDNLWNYGDLSGWDQDSWDSDSWDEYPQTELFLIIDALRYDVFKDQLIVNYNKLWFALLYFTFTDQEQVDWAHKTTFVQLKVRERGDGQANIYHGDQTESVIDYVNNVKPFRTKLRNVYNIKEVTDETDVTVTEQDRKTKIGLRFNRHGKPCWNQTFVDGANFHVLEPGWDQAPWESIYDNPDCDDITGTAQRPWDADRQTLENLYLKDIYDGSNFGLPRNPADDIFVEGNKFVHPEYEGYPEEQANILPFDAVNIRVETNKVGTPTVTAGPTYSVNSEETGPRGLTFNNDGTKMFVVGTTGDDVNEYTLSTGFDLSSTVTFIDSFPVPECPNPMSIKFNPDGTKMFVTGVGNNNVHEYALTTGFDVSTAGFTQTLVTTVDNDNFGLDFKPDGTKMWITGDSNNKIYEFNLSTGFDISTATFNQDLSMTAYDIEPFGIEWSTDGKRLFVVGTRGNGVDEWRASTPWDISTITHVGFYHIGGNPSGIHFSPDGYKMFILGNSSDLVKSYTLSDPYRLIGLDGNIPSSTTLSFHMFKDMMGDFHIHRVANSHTTALATDLNKGDNTIDVVDATKLTQPDVENYVPGVIWIGPERIEFWGVDGNTLTNITRGTLGTPEVNHKQFAGSGNGSIVIDAGRESEIPGVARYVNYLDNLFPAYNDFGSTLHNSSNPEATFIKAGPGIISNSWTKNTNGWTP